MFSIYSITARLYEAPLIFAYGVGLPKVIGPREGRGERCTLLHKSRFEREITRALSNQETSIIYIKLLVVMSSLANL